MRACLSRRHPTISGRSPMSAISISTDGPRYGARGGLAGVRDGLVWAESMSAMARSIHEPRRWVLLLIHGKSLDAEQNLFKSSHPLQETRHDLFWMETGTGVLLRGTRDGVWR